ncbi:MAG: hypothetical protein ACKVS9_00215 [Phycisphaerae bacterium]
MGILDKLFGGETKGEALLRAYGKLPYYAEYRRLEISPGAATAFSQWLDAGRLAWAKSPSKGPAGSVRSLRAMLRIPGTKEIAIASIWDSRDSLGRMFPFCFFVIGTPDSFGATPAEQWAAATTLCTQFDRYYVELRSLGGGGDFYKLFNKRTLPTKPTDIADRARGNVDAARAIDAGAWLRSWVHNAPGDRHGWFTAAATKSEWFRGHPDSIGDVAMSFPLAVGFPVAAQASLWLDWASPALTKVSRTPSVIAPSLDSGSPDIHLIVRDLVPDDFQLLTTDDAAYSYVERISYNGQAGGAPSGSLLEFLKSPPVLAAPASTV